MGPGAVGRAALFSYTGACKWTARSNIKQKRLHVLLNVRFPSINNQVLVPVAFFGLMCIPKHYIKPQLLPRQIISRPYDLDMGLTSKPGSAEYFGAALMSHDHADDGCSCKSRFKPHYHTVSRKARASRRFDPHCFCIKQ